MLTPERKEEIREHLEGSLSEDHAGLTVRQGKELLAEIDRLQAKRVNSVQVTLMTEQGPLLSLRFPSHETCLYYDTPYPLEAKLVRVILERVT